MNGFSPESRAQIPEFLNKIDLFKYKDNKTLIITGLSFITNPLTSDQQVDLISENSRNITNEDFLTAAENTAREEEKDSGLTPYYSNLEYLESLLNSYLDS